jgi:hypothetical protein
VLDSAFWASPVTLPWLLTLLCLGGLMVLFLGVTWRVIRWHGAQFQRRIRNQCQSCGYDLRATPDRCPECGAPAPLPLGEAG